MPTTFAIPHVDAALGGSVIYDEYKGNYAQARQIAERQLAAARAQPDAAVLADALLARGVVHLLQGEAAAARARLDEVQAAVPNDPARLLRAASYGSLAEHIHAQLFPNGAEAEGITFDEQLRDPLYRALAHYEAMRSSLETQTDDPAALLEAEIVFKLLRWPAKGRAMLAKQPLFAPDFQAMLLQTVLGVFDSTREVIERVDASPALGAFFDLTRADLHRRARSFTEMQTLVEQAYAGYQRAADVPGYAASLMAFGDWLAAPFSTPLAWNYALDDGLGNVKAGPGREDIVADRSTIDVANARAVYTRAARLFAKAGALRGVAAVKLRFGYLATLSDKYSQAFDLISQARRDFEALGDHLAASIARAHEALCLVGLGRIPEDRASAAALGQWGRGEGSVSFALGLGLLFVRVGQSWLVRSGDYERCLACYRLAEAVFVELGADSTIAKLRADAGRAYGLVGDTRAALEAFEQAQERLVALLAKQPRVTPELEARVADINSEIYVLYLGLMDSDGMERTVARRALLLGQLQQRQQADNDMAAFFNPLLALMTTSHAEQTSVLAPIYRAVKARDAGDDKAAQQQFALAFDAIQQVPEHERGALETTLLAHQRNYPAAAEAYRRSLASGGPIDQVAALFQADSMRAGNWGRAQQRLTHEQRYEQAMLAFVRLRAYPDALACAIELERLAGPTWWQRNAEPWEDLATYGELLEGLGKLPEALDYCDHAIALFEARRGGISRDELKTAFSGDRNVQFLYFLATRIALALQLEAEGAGKDAEAREYAARAFECAERGRARGLLDLLSSTAAHGANAQGEGGPVFAWRQLNARRTVWQRLLANERALDTPQPERIATLLAQIDEADAQLRQIERALATSDPDFYRAINPQAGVASLAAICSHLPPDTALLQYTFLDEHMLAWAITPAGMGQAYRADINAKRIDRQIRAFQRACARGEATQQLGDELAATFLRPLAEAIEGHTHLIVVPYGSAHTLPFHALPWNGAPLIATHTLSYLPSASVLPLLGGRRGAVPERLLAIGNPAMMAHTPPLAAEPRALRPLRHAATEAAFVASLFPEGKALIGAHATEAAVREQLPHYPLLHFATHGYLSQEAPLLSSIVLAHGEEITVEELMGMRLQAELVVLSACNTGQGEATGGDDVLGLARGLLSAGVRAAIVSLWPVDDEATCLLIGQFFRQFRAGQSPRAALRSAQRYLQALNRASASPELAKLDAARHLAEDAQGGARDTGEEDAVAAEAYAHPYYWAPFVLIGE